MNVELRSISFELISSFHQCVMEVAKERAYLAVVEAPSPEAIEYAIHQQVEGRIPMVLAVASQRVVGWCSIAKDAREGFRHVGVLGIGILNEFREKGIGRCLLAATVEKARKVGVSRIELEVFKSNQRAIHFYKRAAFEV